MAVIGRGVDRVSVFGAGCAGERARHLGGVKLHVRRVIGAHVFCLRGGAVGGPYEGIELIIVIQRGAVGNAAIRALRLLGAGGRAAGVIGLGRGVIPAFRAGSPVLVRVGLPCAGGMGRSGKARGDGLIGGDIRVAAPGVEGIVVRTVRLLGLRGGRGGVAAVKHGFGFEHRAVFRFKGNRIAVAGVIQVDHTAAVRRNSGGGDNRTADFTFFIGKAGIGLFLVGKGQGAIRSAGLVLGLLQRIGAAVKVHLIVVHLIRRVGIGRPLGVQGRSPRGGKGRAARARRGGARRLFVPAAEGIARAGGGGQGHAAEGPVGIQRDGSAVGGGEIGHALAVVIYLCAGGGGRPAVEGRGCRGGGVGSAAAVVIISYRIRAGKTVCGQGLRGVVGMRGRSRGTAGGAVAVIRHRIGIGLPVGGVAEVRQIRIDHGHLRDLPYVALGAAVGLIDLHVQLGGGFTRRHGDVLIISAPAVAEIGFQRKRAADAVPRIAGRLGRIPEAAVDGQGSCGLHCGEIDAVGLPRSHGNRIAEGVIAQAAGIRVGGGVAFQPHGQILKAGGHRAVCDLP